MTERQENGMVGFTDLVERREQVRTNAAAIPTPVLWPVDGDNIRIHANLSRRRDGCLRIKNRAASFRDRNSLIVDARGRIDCDHALFRFYRVPRRSDENFGWLGIPGERLGKDQDKIYMLTSTKHRGKKTLLAKGYPKDPRGIRYPPTITDNTEAASLEFKFEYEGNGIFTFRDNSEWSPAQYYYLQSNGEGAIERVKRNSRLHLQEYNNPGMLFYIMHLGDDDALNEGN